MTESTSTQQPSLSHAAAKSGLWLTAAALVVRLLRVSAFFALARLVVPEAFGQLALASALVLLLQTASTLGLHQYVIRSDSLNDDTLDTVFWTTAVSGLVFSAVALASAWPVAAVTNEPVVGQVVAALSPLPFLAALASVPTGVLWRRLQYRSLAMRNVFAAVLSVVVAGALAWAGAGVWALVAQLVVEALVGTVFLWFAACHYVVPSWRWSLAEARRGTSFGVRVVASDLLAMASFKTDDIIVGVRLGAAQLGIYSAAYRILMVLRETVQSTSGTVAFGMFARIQADRTRLRTAFLRALNVNAAIAFPVFLTMAASGQVVVAVLLGPQWDAAGPVVSALCVVGVAAAVSDMCVAALTATGHASDSLRLAAINLVLNVVAFLIAVQWGLLAVAVAFSVRAYLMLPVVLMVTRVRLGISVIDVLRKCVPVLVACVLPVALCLVASSWRASPFVVLPISLAGAVAAYAAGLRIVSRSTAVEVLGVMRHAFDRRRAAA